MSQEPVQQAAPTAPAEGPRRAVVLLMIFTTAAIFVALVAILYFRWANAQEPSSVMIVATTPAFEGAEVIVEGVALPQPHRVVLGERPETPFYLDRGSYTIRIVYGERTIYRGEFVLNRNEGRRIDLAQLEHLLPATRPATGEAPDRPRTAR